MDYNDDFSPSRLNRNEITEFEQTHINDGEDTENCLEQSLWRSLNGVHQQDMYNCPEQHSPQYHQHDVKDNFYHKNVSSVHFEKMPTVPLANFRDILSTNKQNMEGSQIKSAPAINSYESLKFGGRVQNLLMLPEDLRISKIIRRLMMETNRKAALDLCQKLETAVRNQSNGTYICRSFDILFENMLMVLLQCPIECLESASTILGIMGYINRYDFAIYKGHLTKAYGDHKSIRKYLMIALKTTLKCDALNLDLKTYSERLLDLLKEYLENAEVTENFISISETIAEFSKNYKASFQKHFTDIVDIIIGWHLEVEQPVELKRHCSKIMQQLAEYFLNELDFTFGLLGQFIEDIEACRDDMLSEKNSLTVKQQTEIRVGAFIGAFLSIVKALTFKGINLNEFGNAAVILRNAKEVINKIASICFNTLPLLSEETVVNLNEFYTTILLYDKTVENLNLFENIIQLQLKHLATFNDNQQASFLFMVLNLVRQYRTQLPLSFITLLLAADNQVLQELKLSCGKKSHKLLMKIYHEILIIKNVPLLQEAYRHILDDINATVATLQTKDAAPDAMMRCEMLFNFYLASLTALACQTSSIIGMYALKPSILELLIINCRGASYYMWHKYPTLHRALLELLVDHCKKNHNFRQSSRLLQQHQDSPSSENFAMILKFLAELLKWHVSELVFKWVENILQECLEDFEILTKKEDFLNICENITLSALKQPEECSGILEFLLKYPKLPEHILANIRDLTMCVMESSDKNLTAVYCKMLAQIPLDIALTPNCGKQFHVKHKQKLLTLYQWHKASAWYNGLRPKYFKTFLESLEPIANANHKLYTLLIEKSSCNLQREHFVEYLKILQENEQLLSYHLQNEAARYCVQQKLRTTLGKPQETFLGIEAIIMKYARFLAEREGLSLPYKNLLNVMEVQENCRMLLGFLECLEKHIYNASEGTAYAMLPAEKPAKTFFRVNAPTCREWFKRIRTAVNLISIHCMEPAMVIRYSETILQTEANHSNMALLDRTVTSLVWALYNCGEPDTLHGLYIWLKTKHGKRFEWILHVADQASGYFEKAAAGYLHTLQEENTKSMDNFLKEFIQRQLTDCFYHTARWSEIPAVSQETVYSKQHLQIMDAVFQSSGYQTFNWQNQELNVALVELTEWPKDNICSGDKNKLTPKLDTFSYYEVLRKLQDSCITKTISAYLNNGVVESIENSVQQGIREGLLHGYEPGSNNNQLEELIIINHVSQKMLREEEIKIFYNKNSSNNKLSSLALSKCLYWSLLRSGQQNVGQQCNLLLNLAAKARLENNLNYCQSLLHKFFKMKNLNLNTNEIAQKLKMKQLAVDFSDNVLVHGLEEMVKCIYAQTSSVSETLELASACCSEILEAHKDSQTAENFSHTESLSNILLSMADWLNIQRLNNANLTNGQLFQKLQNLLPEIPCFTHSDNAKPNSLPTSEYYVGKLLNASIMCKCNSGEAWFAYGNWCYRWGKKLMEAKTEEQSPAAHINDAKDIKLTKRNIFSIQETLKDKFDVDTIEKIAEVLNKNIISVINDDSAEDLDTNLNAENTTEILQQELKNVCDLDGDQLKEIFAIWRQAQKGVYTYYEEATRAYFKYLAIESDEVSQRSDTVNSDNNEVEDCTFVTTTLRILRLIVKHAIGLQDVLEDGLRNTPLRPWKVIVPQLFSRLNHHEPYVKKSLRELLCRLAVNQPQLIIFPAVVGAQQELKHRNNADSQALLTNCFGTLLNSLSEQKPETVLQVQLLVKELRRITLLWDEYWVHSLSQLYAEYSSLYNSLDAEAKKCNNTELIQAKYEVFRQHLLTDFKQIAAFTDKEPETNYERSFQERFGAYIEAALKELQKSNEEANPSEYWQKIKQLYNVLQQRPLRGNSSVLRISEISPVLANMQNTTIAMPGVDTYAQPAVYIKSVDVTTFIFTSTKTKPKKLSFFGSNGQRYTYLFKGQEDLHLDERIMQFLAISNSMMARSYGSKAKIDCFKANHYAVIPLGSRSGLIRWVDNCSPLFAIYKKWQQRDALLKQQQKERQSSKGQENMPQSPVATNATRPSELFYNKLTPLLAECNLKVSDPRRQWPASVLKRVLKELSAETPKDLLSKEIWCYSANAVEWRKSVRRYSLSLAVMSIIGYVIGLGDRHLDNMLIKLSTGEVLHIDYSVCFEKGKTLRVPEKVPFRMTQNLKDALGLVGTEGAFRIACTHVLKILRKERETLLTLLEAFVYDPLVDWTVSDDGTTTISRRTSAHTAANIIASLNAKTAQNSSSPKSLNKNKKLEVDLSRQTLALRITEIKPTAFKYKNDFDAQLEELHLHIQNLLDARKTISQLDQERDNFSKQLSMVRELEALGSAQASHAFIQRYHVYKNELDNLNKIKLMVQKTFNELDLLLSTYFNVISNPEVMQNLDINISENEGVELTETEFDAIKDIVIDNNWHNAYVQAKFNRHDMENAFVQTKRSALECRDLLMFYSRVMLFYPRSQLQNYRLIKYKNIFSNLLGVGQKSDDAFEVDSKQNIECCEKYFEIMNVVTRDLQETVMQAKTMIEEHKQQPIITISAALTSINDFVSLNPSNNSEIIIICMLRHILQASQSFQQHDQTLVQNCDYFLPNKRLNFVLLIKKFVGAIYETCNNTLPQDELFNFLLATLECICNTRETLELLANKLLSVFSMDYSVALKEMWNNFEKELNLAAFEKHTIISGILCNVDVAMEKLGTSLKLLQEQILQSVKENNINEMAFCNININNLMQKVGSDLKITLVSTLKHSLDSLILHDIDNIFDIRKIRNSINNLMFNLQSQLFDGLLEYAIQNLNKIISSSLATPEIINEFDLANADLLCGNLYAALQHELLMVYYDFVATQQTTLLEQYQLVATAYYWWNEPYLNAAQHTPSFITKKQEFLTRLHEVYQVLVVWKSTMLKIQDDLELHRNSFKDLMRSLSTSEDMRQFEDNIQFINQRYTQHLNLCIRLSEYAAVVLQFEMCPDAQPFENLIKLYDEAHQQWLQSESSVTAVERNLVLLLDPEDKIDQYWIDNVAGLLDEMIFSVQKKISDLEKVDQTLQNTLLADGQQLQTLLDSSLRSELRQLLKILSKICKQNAKSDCEEFCLELKSLQQSIKLLQTKLHELQAQLLSKEYDAACLLEMQENLKQLLNLCKKNNDELNVLLMRFLQFDAEREQQAGELKTSSQNDLANKEIIDGQVGEQKRNAYAVSVWKRIRMKLEGRDPDHNRRSTAAEQVEFIIREATNEENLASLYEGWTPWV